MAPTEEQRSWLLIPKPDSADHTGALLLNLDSVRLVEITNKQEIRLCFTDEHTVHIAGSAATEVLEMLFLRARLTDGTPALLNEKASGSQS
jgi:hypothetical protein